MIAGAPLAPDGLEALACLVALRGLPAEAVLGAELAAQLPVVPPVQALDRLTQVLARRTMVGGEVIEGRSEAARFLRRRARRWRITQAPIAPLPDHETLVRWGRRARGLGWEAPDDQSAGLRVFVWATADAGRRRDLVALAPAEVGHYIGHAPPLPADQAQALIERSLPASPPRWGPAK